MRASASPKTPSSRSAASSGRRRSPTAGLLNRETGDIANPMATPEPSLAGRSGCFTWSASCARFGEGPDSCTLLEMRSPGLTAAVLIGEPYRPKFGKKGGLVSLLGPLALSPIQLSAGAWEAEIEVPLEALGRGPSGKTPPDAPHECVGPSRADGPMVEFKLGPAAIRVNARRLAPSPGPAAGESGFTGHSASIVIGRGRIVLTGSPYVRLEITSTQDCTENLIDMIEDAIPRHHLPPRQRFQPKLRLTSS